MKFYKIRHKATGLYFSKRGAFIEDLWIYVAKSGQVYQSYSKAIHNFPRTDTAQAELSGQNKLEIVEFEVSETGVFTNGKYYTR